MMKITKNEKVHNYTSYSENHMKKSFIDAHNIRKIWSTYRGKLKCTQVSKKEVIRES
jgi:hypothetical protein